MDGRPIKVKKNFRISVIKSGQFLGEKEILENIPRTTTAMSAEDCELFFMSKQKMK